MAGMLTGFVRHRTLKGGLAPKNNFLKQFGRNFAADASGMRVVVAGCGVSGASTAMHLARNGAHVVLIDPRPPMTASSQYSTECYREFFLDPALVPFMKRSIDIMEELTGEDNVFNMSRRGYAFFSATEAGIQSFETFAETASSYGGGLVRKHSSAAGYVKSPAIGFKHPDMVGFDLVYGSEAIREIFPFVSENTKVMLHARRCGWLDSQGLGMAMLRAGKEAQNGGSLKTVLAGVSGFEMSGDTVKHVYAGTEDGQKLSFECDAFVNAAGAWTSSINTLLAPGDELPLSNELHSKVILNDKHGIIPQDDAPFMVWRDRVDFGWDEEMREGLLELDDTPDGGVVNSSRWVEEQPGGAHLRPCGNGRVLLLWEHLHRHIEQPLKPAMPVENILDMYPELCVAGLKHMVPGLERYEGQLGRDTVTDGGYYTAMPDARPLAGRHGASNAYVCGGMGTYGLMGSPAAGELTALCVLGLELPEYAGACSWPRTSIQDVKPIDLLDDSA